VHGCPACKVGHEPRPEVCNTCGLWWVPFGERDESVPLRSRAEPQLPLRLLLRHGASIGLVGVSVLICFSSLGYLAADAIWSLHDGKAGLLGWAALLVSFPLALLVGTSCSAMLLQEALHGLFPARLHIDESHLRMSAWITWEGLLSGFRRINVTVPRCELTGVMLSLSQGGHSQLFLVHSCGLAFATGWSGTRETALRFGNEILRCLDPANEESRDEEQVPS
jgi:hypothetical protein